METKESKLNWLRRILVGTIDDTIEQASKENASGENPSKEVASEEVAPNYVVPLSHGEQKKVRKEFIETLYDTLESAVSPTPFMEISGGKSVDVRFLNGKARLPMPKTTEINVLDIDVASLFFDDFHILYEGVTGIGKTYTSDALFDAIFGPDGHYTMRLSGGVIGSSAIEPFTTTALVNGIPKTEIDPEKCKRYGALFIDEINRGDSQEVLQVVDGVIRVNGDTGYLRVPIPGTDRYKGLSVIAAMNPSDAQHSSALELDIAGENRFLRFIYPNGVTDVGSSQLEKRVSGSLHDRLWTEYSKRTGHKGGWRENYPIITDPEQFSRTLNGQAKEFMDAALGYVGEDPNATYRRNAELMQQGGVKPAFMIREDNDYNQILQAQGTLKHGFVRRDLIKIENLSRLIAFIKGIKRGTYDVKIDLNDVAAGIGVVLESKTVTGTDYGGLMALVNDARATYGEMLKQGNIPNGFGIRQAIWQAAIYAGQEKGFDNYINTLKAGMNQLNTPAESAAQGTIRSRILSDLVVLEHFSKAYEKEVSAALRAKGDQTFKGFHELYQAKKGQSSIYEHRLGPIMG